MAHKSPQMHQGKSGEKDCNFTLIVTSTVSYAQVDEN